MHPQEHIMKSTIHRLFIVGMTLGCLLGVNSGTTALAQENPPAQPVELPCATNVSAQVLGRTPVEGSDQNLLLVRITFGADGSIGLHTHPGTLVVTVETGSLGFTYMDEGEMTITRAATADAEASEEAVAQGEEVALDPGDSFIEMGMVHSARNMSDEPTSVLLAGLIEKDQPLTICSEEGTPMSDVYDRVRF
jgi:quercetin dioxygenase-like cupin family protein